MLWLWDSRKTDSLAVKLTKLTSLSVLNYIVIWNTDGSHHCQILYLWICLLAKIYLGPQSQNSGHLHDHSQTCQSVREFSHSVVSDSLWPHGPQHPRPPCPSPTPGVYANSCPSSRWCHPTISSFVVPFSSCLQSFPASGSFQISQLFTSGGQNIGVSASTSVLPMNTQYWYPLGWTGWISLQSKGL